MTLRRILHLYLRLNKIAHSCDELYYLGHVKSRHKYMHWLQVPLMTTITPAEVSTHL